MNLLLNPGKKKVLSLLLLCLLVIGPVAPNVAKAATEAELLAWIQELTIIVERLKQQVLGGAPVAEAPFTSDVFPQPVVYGSTNNSILLLQQILATDPAIYPDGSATGYFGNLTEAALSKFQTTFGLSVTGTFTEETGTILSNTLTAIPLDLYPGNYLTVAVVKTRIASEAELYRLEDTVVGGKVVINAVPTFSATMKSSDTATLQRIMATDSQIYPERKVTGLMDMPTQQAVIKLRQRYGFSYTVPQGESIVISELLNAKTVDLVRKILVVNNAPTIASDLLKKPGVAPEELIDNSSRTLSKIRATRDYRKNQTSVAVYYEGGAAESFTTPVVSPDAAVVTEVANKLDRPEADVKSVIYHDSVYGDDMAEIVLYVYLTNSMELDITYVDGTEENFPIGFEEIDLFVYYAYGGDYGAYERDFEEYVERERDGENIDLEVAELISSVIGRPKAEIAEVLKINIEQYSNDDPCWEGYNWVCGGA